MSLAELIKSELPLNRKERYFTGTVFPMIVCKDDFKYFHLLTSLITGFGEGVIDCRPNTANIQFFTEYSLAESVVGPIRERFSNLPASKDTPDIMILIKSKPKVLLAFEAKMFDTPTGEDLERQMAGQAAILNYLKEKLKINKVFHYALIPKQFKSKLPNFGRPILTWQQICDSFSQTLGNDYFLAVLKLALESYDELVSKSNEYGQNCEEKLPGLEIYNRFKNGDDTIQTMGRHEGLKGKALQNDIRSGKWQQQLYETSSKSELFNRNWFFVSQFVELIDK